MLQAVLALCGVVVPLSRKSCVSAIAFDCYVMLTAIVLKQALQLTIIIENSEVEPQWFPILRTQVIKDIFLLEGDV